MQPMKQMKRLIRDLRAAALIAVLSGMFILTLVPHGFAETWQDLLAAETMDIAVRPLQDGTIVLEGYPPRSLGGIAAYELVIVDESGIEQRKALGSEPRYAFRPDPRQTYRFRLIARDASGLAVVRSPEDRYLSAEARERNATAWLERQPGGAASSRQQAPNLQLVFDQVDPALFPVIFSRVRVDTSGVALPGLPVNDFQAFEDGTLQTDCFGVTDIGTGCVDMVFLIDNSGSMCDEILDVKNNVKAFADSLVARGYDFRLCLVRFGQSDGSGQPIVVGCTADVNTFKTWADAMTCDGGLEPGIPAVVQAIQTLPLRPGCLRHFLVSTDEPSNNPSGSVQQACTLANANNVTVNVAALCSVFPPAEYCDPTSSIWACTGGSYFPVAGPYSTVLDSIAQDIGGSGLYAVQYCTNNPLCDGVRRQVVICATAFTETACDTAYYTPCQGPRIDRTQATKDLSLSPCDPLGSPLTIQAYVTDDVPPPVQNVSLFYRTTGSTSYTETAMAHVADSLYSVVIPGPSVASPGVDFYIRATDGVVAAFDPQWIRRSSLIRSPYARTMHRR